MRTQPDIGDKVNALTRTTYTDVTVCHLPCLDGSLSVVLGRETYTNDESQGWFTRMRDADGQEFSGHYRMSQVEAYADLIERCGFTPSRYWNE